MKTVHIFTGIAALLMAGTLLLPYQVRVSYDGDFAIAKLLGLLPKKEYVTGLSLWNTWPPVITLVLTSMSLAISRNLATAIMGMALSGLMLLYMAFLAFILTFTLNFGGGLLTKELGIGYFASLAITIGFLPLMIVHLSKTLRKGREVKVREDVLDL